MATISLYNRPELLRSGNQTLRPAQFQLADSGLASGLGQIAKISANIASDLNQKAQKAEDSTTLINLDRDLTETNLTLSKWQMENSNNGQIMKDGSSLWETKTRETYDNLMSRYNDINMTPETRQRVNTIINHHAGNAITSSWAGGIKQIGNNFDSEFNTSLTNIEQNGDGTIARLSVDTARSGGVINDAQSQAREQAISNAENRFKLNSINTQAKTLIETAAFDPNNYDKAKGLYKTAFESNLITKDEYNAQVSNIDYKFQYNDKLKQLELDINLNPSEVQNKFNKPAKIGEVSTIAISTEKVPEPLKPHISSFEKYGKQYGVDPNLLLSISLFETGNGTSSAFRNKNNAMGISDDSGPTVQPSVEASVEKMARLIGQSPTYKNAKTIEDLANIYSPPGASNDPNQTNSQWPSSVRAKYKEITGTELPKEYNFRNLNAGEYSWLTPNDRKIVEANLRDKFKTFGSIQFNDLKDEIDIGKYSGLTQEGQTDFDEKLSSNSYLTPIMKDTLSLYRSSKIDQNFINSPTVIGDLRNEIVSYATRFKNADDSKSNYDEDQLEYIQLGNKIDLLTNGFVQSELRSQLTEISQNKESRAQYTKLSPALKLLRSTVLDSKEQEIVDVPERGMWWWKTPPSKSPAFKERKVVDDKGKEVTVKEPVYREFSEQEKQDRLTRYSEIEQNLRNYLKTNPNATPEQVFGTLVNDPLYQNYRKSTAVKPKSTTINNISDKRSTIISRLTSAKTKDELNTLESEIRSLNDSTLMETFNRRRDSLK